jgi:hypothetical protein
MLTIQTGSFPQPSLVKIPNPIQIIKKNFVIASNHGRYSDSPTHPPRPVRQTLLILFDHLFVVI